MRQAYFAIGIAITVIALFLGVLHMHEPKSIQSVRIAYEIEGFKVEDLDPSKIEMIPQSLLMDNLYTQLIVYDEQGHLKSGIAKKFYWKGLDLIFEFGDKARTSTGHYIDAEDAAISIRRALRLGSTTHSNLQFMVCGSVENLDPFKDCEGVRVVDGKLIVTVRDEKYKPFLLQTLSTEDYVIVPKDAIDQKTLSIKSHRITSGPYYLDSADNDKWVLKANKGHFQLMNSSPQEVVLISTEKESALELFSNNKVDLLTTMHNLHENKFKEMAKSVPDFNLSKTLDIKLYYIQFSPSAVSRSSLDQRVSVAEKFRSVMKSQYPLPVFSSETRHFFLDQSLGKLSKKQEDELVQIYEQSDSRPLSNKFSFYSYNSLKDIFDVFDQIPEIDPIHTNRYPFTEPISERLDVFMATTDTAFEENLALLSYNFTQGTFGLDKYSSREWLEDYFNSKEKSERADKIQKLHYKALKQGILFPLFKAPYTSLGRNGYSLPLSPLFAGSQFWKIIKK